MGQWLFWVWVVVLPANGIEVVYHLSYWNSFIFIGWINWLTEPDRSHAAIASRYLWQYRTWGQKSWMNSRIVFEWLLLKKVSKSLQDNQNRILFIDNCCDHNPTETLYCALYGTGIEVIFFPKMRTAVVHPCDYFGFRRLRIHWTQRGNPIKLISSRTKFGSCFDERF